MSVEIGSHLRQAREAIGMSLEELQEKTRIQKSFLIAIENGEFHKLPSPFYVRTYLRSYANCVKIEPHHILRQYRKMEQAERLTGVHKAVTEKDLSKTQRLPLQSTGKISALSGVSGAQKEVAQATGRMPAVGNTLQRTNTHTALTARRTETDARMRDREIARRDLGYQRTMSMTGSMHTVSPRPSAKSEMLPTAKEGDFNKSSQQDLSQQTEKTFHSIPPRRQTTSPRLGSPGLSNTGSIPPTKSSDAFKSTSLGASQPHQSLQSSRRLDVLSQTGSSSRSKEHLSKQNPQQESTSSLRLTQDAGKMQTLSRSAVKNKSPKTVKFPKSVSIAVASLVVCIPLAWAIFSFIGDDESSSTGSTTTQEKKENNQGNTGSETGSGSQQPVTPTSAEIKLAEQTSMTNVYHLSGVTSIEIRFQGSSWIQMRKDPYSEQSQSSVLQDFTIKNETVNKTHDFSVDPELWIVLGKPENVTITVNGETIKPAKSLNLKLVQ